jgi:hypothetical protein
MPRAFADIDANLKSWSDRIARIGKSIEMLSQNPTFLRLKTQSRLGALQGVSKARGALAVSAVDQLWSLYLALDKTLAGAEELRGGKNPFTVESRYAQIDALLSQPSIEPPADPTSLATLTLDGGPTRKMTLADVFGAMDKAFNEARDIVAAAARGWESAGALDPLRERAASLSGEARGLHFVPPPALAEAGAALDAADRATEADPLGADDSAKTIGALLDSADAALSGARKDHGEAKAFLKNAEARLGALAALCEEVRATREKRLATIAEPAPEAEPPADPAPELRNWLDTLKEAMESGRARAVLVGARSWTAKIVADEAALAACRDADKKLLDARADLRGRFSALKARADDLKARGRLSPENAALVAQTADLLFGRPTPLPEAVQMVRRCDRI